MLGGKNEMNGKRWFLYANYYPSKHLMEPRASVPSWGSSNGTTVTTDIWGRFTNNSSSKDGFTCVQHTSIQPKLAMIVVHTAVKSNRRTVKASESSRINMLPVFNRIKFLEPDPHPDHNWDIRFPRAKPLKENLGNLNFEVFTHGQI